MSSTVSQKPDKRHEVRFVKREGNEPPLKKLAQNLMTHLPGEATALYLAGLDATGLASTPPTEADAGRLIVIALVSLAVLFLVRILAKSTVWVTVLSAVAFVIWVYSLGNGPFQALGIGEAKGMGAFLVIAYSAIVTALATYTKIFDK
jgi:hypothetical protein